MGLHVITSLSTDLNIVKYSIIIYGLRIMMIIIIIKLHTTR